ncbi:hypothetical protein HK096_001405 [Nowakowskiella sp. JEL0078]|nr:hypothetical protein HK096_001405 [Nowakowskiella sp. JEL0078]
MDLTQFGSLHPNAVEFPNEYNDNFGYTLQTVNGENLSPSEFRKKYDEEFLPFMINGSNWIENWTASKEWSVENMADKYGDLKFNIGNEYGHPRNVNMDFRDYVDYMKNQRDEAPLYIFDGNFGEKCPELLNDYFVPSIFEEDYFSVLGSQRPPFRWIVIGPERSGASWHIDPMGTSAWNALLSGRKRWALYPPSMLPPGIEFGKNADGSNYFKSPTSLLWYLEIYPYLPPDRKPIEIVQEPGQIIFVPAGWWHLILNLDKVNLAVTQNFVGKANLPIVCSDIVENHMDEMFVKFKNRLLTKKPELSSIFSEVETQSLLVPTDDQIILDEGFNSRVEFSSSFDWIEEGSPWRKKLIKILKNHSNIYGEIINENETLLEITPMSGGQNPVFLHEPTKTIIKLYVHISGGLSTYISEVFSYFKLSSNLNTSKLVPSLLAHELLVKDGNFEILFSANKIKIPETGFNRFKKKSDFILSPWPYPYTITTAVENKITIKEVMLNLNTENWNQIIPWLAKTTATFHNFEINTSQERIKLANPFDTLHTILYPALNSLTLDSSRESIISSLRTTLIRTDFSYHIKMNLKKAIASHAQWGHLSQHLQSQLSTYLPKSIDDLWDPSDRTYATRFLHGDLNFENILGSLSADKIFTPQHVIDFGDSFHAIPWGTESQMMDPLWDFVAIHISTLNCNPQLFRMFWGEYWKHRKCLDDDVKKKGETYITRAERKRLLVYILLFEFQGVVRWIKKVVPGVWKCQSFEEVEVLLFGEA